MPEGPPPPGYPEFRDAEFTRLVDRSLRVRLTFAPVVAGVVILLAAATPRLGLRAALLGTAAALLYVSWSEYARFRRRGIDVRSLAFNLIFVAAAQGVVVLLTGGVLSPLIVVLLPLALFGSYLLGPSRLLVPFVLLQQGTVAVALWGRWSGVLPPGPLAILGRGAAIPEALPHALALGVVVSVVLAATTSVGVGLRQSTDGMLRRAFEARQGALRSHQERVVELSALTGEIAHELKNPLATVRGLAALVDRGLAPGKDTERMVVLRREVDRMEQILGDFLNFSRPLLPLDHAPLDARALLRDVAALFEGVARERGVALRIAAAAPVRLRADGRKIHQVLVNLLQNALDASPSGAEVELGASVAASGIVIEVLDRGVGLPAEQDPEHLFEAGFTGKEHGSGLGLTIARSLVRQHGGELRLDRREGGGLCARIELPRGDG